MHGRREYVDPVQRTIARRPHRPLAQQRARFADALNFKIDAFQGHLSRLNGHELATGVVRNAARRSDQGGRQAVRLAQADTLRVGADADSTHRPAFNVKNRRTNGNHGERAFFAFKRVAARAREVKLTAQFRDVGQRVRRQCRQRLLSEQSQLPHRVQISQDDFAGRTGMQRQAQTDFGGWQGVAPAFFRCNEHNAVAIEHRQMYGFTDGVTQFDHFVLGRQAQIKITPDFMRQLQQPKTQPVGLGVRVVAQQALAHQR